MEKYWNILNFFGKVNAKEIPNTTQFPVFSQLLASATVCVAHRVTLSSVCWEQPAAQGIKGENYFPLLPHSFLFGWRP